MVVDFVVVCKPNPSRRYELDAASSMSDTGGGVELFIVPRSEQGSEMQRSSSAYLKIACLARFGLHGDGLREGVFLASGGSKITLY